MTESKQAAGAAIAVLVGASLIGLAPIGVRLSELGPVATNFWRFLFALPILALWAAKEGPVARPDRGLLLLAGLFFALELNLWAVALTKTTVANATLIANMTPIFAALFGWLFLKERIARAVLLGGAVALTGALMLAHGRAPGPASIAEADIGDAMATAAAVFYAAYLLMVRAIGKRVGVGGVMFWAGLSGVVGTLIAALALGETLAPQTWQGWLILIGLGVVVQVGGQGLIAYGVGRLPILASTVMLWMQPLAAAALSWMLFGEALGPVALLGAALILAGLFLVQRMRALPAAKVQ